MASKKAATKKKAGPKAVAPAKPAKPELVKTPPKEGKTQKVNVWLTPEQVEWLKAKKNLSETIRAMVTEAMTMDALMRSVKKKR